MFEQLGLIGCGLMGGSFALALKQAGLVQRVVGYSKSPSTTQLARELGVIDVEAPSALLAVSGADIVLLAVPVAATEETFKSIRHLLSPDTLVMDVGSTKSDIVAAARTVLREQLPCFVPAHPIAGREVAGVRHADARLYQDRQVILTPLPETRPDHLARAEQVWKALGSRVRHMTPEAHDTAYAAVSHLPHLVAFAAMNAIAAQPQAREFLSLAGPGFRDFTRIAASDPSVWRDILLANRANVLAQSAQLRAALDALEACMQTPDGPALQQLIEKASDARSAWTLPSASASVPDN
ncbi:MAG: prephenate dehydrogenase/arogenate dehydrogenase family protein [Serpentinimonas sp.]|jgi:prephenate dehydrogenase|nr:prephenate dehydrogenase/arogenate dehydrogenase family protein [Serpentinimonas sp.]